MKHRPDIAKLSERVDLALEPAFALGGLDIRPSTLEVRRNAERWGLEPRVMQVLVALVRRTGEVVSRDALIESCWSGRIVGEDAIQRTVAKLRHALAEAGLRDAIETVPRVGYRFAPLRLAAPAEPSANPKPPGLPEPSAPGPLPWPLRWAMSGALVLFVLAVGLLLWSWSQAPGGWIVERYQPVAETPLAERSPSLSRDGRFLAYAVDTPGIDQLEGGDILVRRLPDGEPQNVTRTPSVKEIAPAWSPDGSQIAFIRFGSLSPLRPCQIVAKPYPEGAERVVGRCAWAAAIHRLSWSPDGRRLLISEPPAPGAAARMREISLADGIKRDLLQPAPGAQGDYNSTYSPDGQKVAFVRHMSQFVSDVYVLDVRSRKLRRVSHDNAFAWIAWSPDSKGVFATSSRQGALELWWYPLAGTAAPRRVTVALQQVGRLDTAPGLIAIERIDFATSLVRLSSNGRTSTILEVPTEIRAPAISREGVLAFLVGGDETTLWLQRPGKPPARFARLPARAVYNLDWSPDGRRIAFEGTVRAERDVFILDAESGVFSRLPSPGLEANDSHWSLDGRAVIFSGHDQTGDRIWRQSVYPHGRPEPVSPRGWNDPRPGAGGLYARRLDRGGVWRLRADGGGDLVVPGLSTNESRGLYRIVGDRIFLPRLTPGGDTAVVSRLLAGGPLQLVALTPRMDEFFAIDPRNGDLVYARTERRDFDIGLLKIRRE